MITVQCSQTLSKISLTLLSNFMHVIPDCLHIRVTNELMKSTDITENIQLEQVSYEYFTHKIYDYKETGTHQ